VSSTEGTLIQREKKKTTKAEPLNCSYKQFVHLLEELLCFHAWYKYGGSPIGMSMTQETKDHLNRSIRQMMHRMVLFAPRREGHGWKIQKVHDILHLLVHCDHFGSPDNFDCSHNERQLKDFFKIPAQTSQQRGQETFGKQLATNMQEIHLMQKARISLEYDQVAVHPSKTAVATGSTQPNGIWNYGLSVNPACLIQYSRARSSCIFKWLSCGGTPCQIHPVILDWFAKHWADQIGEDLTEVELYTDLFRERNLRGKLLTERFRAHPNFRGEGEVYDYASIVFAEQGMDDRPIPCKLLGFFRSARHMFGDDTDVDECGIHAIVQPCSYHSQVRGDETKRIEECYKTKLFERWTIHTTCEGRGATRSHVPCLYSAPVEAIHELMYVIEEIPGLFERSVTERFCWTVKDRRTEWKGYFPYTS